MVKMARFGKKYFAYARRIPINDFSKDKSYNADEKKRDPVSCTITCKLLNSLIKGTVWEEIQSWRKLLGKMEYLYIGKSKQSTKKMRLMKVSATDEVFGKTGNMLSATVSLDFEEYHKAKKQSSSTKAGGSVTYSSGGVYKGSYSGGKFYWPVSGHTRVSSDYGWRICPYHGKEEHTGIDVPAPYGTAVRAAADGKVISSCHLGSYGNAIIISHGSNLYTLYGHNSSLVASKGQTVKKGQTIAKVGSTGNSTGNHCHFEVRKGSSKYGSDVNPWTYIKR